MSAPRQCEACGKPLLEGRRRDARTCSGSRCRMRLFRRRLTPSTEALLEEWAATGTVHRLADGSVTLS